MEQAEADSKAGGPHGVTGTSGPKGPRQTSRRRDPFLGSERKHVGEQASVRGRGRECEDRRAFRPPACTQQDAWERLCTSLGGTVIVPVGDR